MDFDQGFDMFSMMEVLFPIFFILIIGFIIFVIFSGVRQWSYNNKQPRLNVAAVVVSKRTEVSGGGADHHSSTWYYITFQVESGDRMELSVTGRDFGLIAEGDAGELDFQGTRFHGFNRRQLPS